MCVCLSNKPGFSAVAFLPGLSGAHNYRGREKGAERKGGSIIGEVGEKWRLRVDK